MLFSRPTLITLTLLQIITTQVNGVGIHSDCLSKGVNVLGSQGLFTSPFTNEDDFDTIAGGLHLYSIRWCEDFNSLVGIQLELSESDNYGSSAATVKMPEMGNVSGMSGTGITHTCYDEKLTGPDGKLKGSFETSPGIKQVTKLTYYTGTFEPADSGNQNEIWTFSAE